MILIDHQTVSGIPFLHIVKEENRDRPAPLVFFIHGFTSAKEHNLHFAYLLAEKGFRAVLPEALYHGERAEQLSAEELAVHFWDIVLNEIEELDVLKKDFEARGLIEDGRIGLAGTSMGGITTFGAMAAYDWVKAGVSLMGSPNYTAFFSSRLTTFKSRTSTLTSQKNRSMNCLRGSNRSTSVWNRKNSAAARCCSGTAFKTKSFRMHRPAAFMKRLNLITAAGPTIFSF